MFLGANSRWYLADADDANKVPIIGLTLGAVDAGQNGRYLLKGYIADVAWAWAIGGPAGMIYASATAGELTQVPPGGTVVAVAVAKTASSMLFCFPAVGGGGGGGGASDPEHTASYIVWSDGLGNYYRKDGHSGVVTSGADAAVIINLAFTTASSGAEFYFKEGEIILNDDLLITKTVKLSGQAIFKAGAALDKDLLTFDPIDGDQILTITGLSFDGDKGTGQVAIGNGMSLYGGTVYIDNIKVYDTLYTGIVALSHDTIFKYVSITNSRFNNCGNPATNLGPAIRIDFDPTAVTTLENVLIQGNRITNGLEHGIKVYPTSTLYADINNNYIDTVHNYGIYLQSPGIISNNIIINVLSDGIIIDTSSKNIVTGNYIVNCGFSSINSYKSNYTSITNNHLITATIGKGVILIDSSNCIVTDNYIETGVGFGEYGTADYNRIEHNIFNGITFIFTGPSANTIVQDNTGYVSDSRGSSYVLGENTLKVVPHGLSATPIRVVVSPYFSLYGKIHIVTAINSVDFTVQLNSVIVAQPVLGTVAADEPARVDESVAANNAAANDMTLLPAVPAVDDAYYFFYTYPFGNLELNIGTSGVGVWTITWEFFTSDIPNWQAVTGLVDGTAGFTAAPGNHHVVFNIPSTAIPVTVWGITGYAVRARVSNYTSIVTQPLGTQVWIHPSVLFNWRASLDELYENSGLADISDANTTYTVNHGCGYTPTAADITITPTSDLYDAAYWYVDTIGAAAFTLHTNVAPGVGNTASFSWSVRRTP